MPVSPDELLAETHALGAQWSISVLADSGSITLLAHRPEQLLRTASVAKVFLLIELAQRLVDGSLDADLLVDRRTSPRVLDSGLWHAMRTETLPVADLALLVGAVSDNWATNALIDLLGLDSVQARAAALAPGGSMLHDYVRDHRDSQVGVPATLSEGCAGDWAMLMAQLHDADGIDRVVCERVLSWLAHDADVSMVAGSFDLDPLAHDHDDLGLRLRHKTGTDAGVRAEVGAVRSSAAVVSYAAVCNWPATDARASTRRSVLATMRRIGEAISGYLDDADA